MNNVILLFSNMKGGTGKTTLCELFATYAVEKDLPVVVYDADVQLSLYKDRQDDLARDTVAVTPWDVDPLVVDNTIMNKIKLLKTIPGVVLVDCPGNVDNPNLQHLFAAADIVVVPFRFDRKNVRETKTFLDVLEKIGVSARMLLLPNMVKHIESQRLELKEAIDLSVKMFYVRQSGKKILPEVWDRTELRVANTISLNSKQRSEVRKAFESIVSYIKK